MTDEEIKKLIERNQNLSYLLGYVTGFIVETKSTTDDSVQKFKWLIQAIQNVVYLDKPIPPMNLK